jgi:hypothetical protein
MSRSVKGAKGPGYEYWSRRSKHRYPGRLSKTLTHRLERRQGKEQVNDAVASETAEAVGSRDEEAGSAS